MCSWFFFFFNVPGDLLGIQCDLTDLACRADPVAAKIQVIFPEKSLFVDADIQVPETFVIYFQELR